MSVKNAENIIKYVIEKLPETTTNGYSRSRLLGMTYLTLKTGNEFKMTSADKLRTDVMGLYSTLSGETTIKDVNQGVTELCDSTLYQTSIDPTKIWTEIQGFRQNSSYGFKEFRVVEQGLKLHIALPKEEDGLLLSIITGELCRQGAYHKIVKDKDSWDKINADERQGKAVTIYPQTLAKSQNLITMFKTMYETIFDNSEIPFETVKVVKDLKFYDGVFGRPSNYGGGALWLGGDVYSDDGILYDDTGIQLKLYNLMNTLGIEPNPGRIVRT